MQSMRRPVDWSLEDNMVDGLFFCATLTAEAVAILELKKWGHCGARKKGANINVYLAW